MEKADWVKLGQIIKQKRVDLDLSQVELAEAINASQPIISLVERGSPVGLSEERKQALFSVLGIGQTEIPIADKPASSATRKKVFISYCHRDKNYLDRLLVHLKPLEKKGVLDVWADTKIMAGDKWKQEIVGALNSCQVAVLFVSADFLASDFIVNNELPPLLEKAQSEGATIIPVILKPCRFVREETLSQFQAINSPAEPVSGMDDHGKELIYDAIAQRVEDIL
jgi:transcriptional regulator with XRE-family HTH domain